MASLPSRVQPGDLIASDLMNELLSELADLEQRVTVLEGAGTAGAGQVVITDILQGSLLQEGQRISIRGRNFDFSIGAQRVYFDTQPVMQFQLGSSDTLLVVDVPTIPGLPALGRSVTLTVSNRSSTATLPVTVVPLPPDLFGTVDVVPQGVSPDPTVPGQNADFKFLLTSRASVSEADFDLNPTITGPAWSDRVRLLDQNGAPLAGGKVHLTRNVGQVVFVRINPIPTGANGTKFDVQLSVSAGKAGGDSGVKSYVVGTSGPAEDNTVTIGGITGDPPTGYANGTISAGTGAGVVMSANVGVQVSGTYDISVAAVADATGNTAKDWILNMLDPTPTNPADPSKGSVPITGSRGIQFYVEPKSTATASGKLQLTVQRQGAPAPKTVSFILQKG